MLSHLKHRLNKLSQHHEHEAPRLLTVQSIPIAILLHYCAGTAHSKVLHNECFVFSNRTRALLVSLVIVPPTSVVQIHSAKQRNRKLTCCNTSCTVATNVSAAPSTLVSHFETKRNGGKAKLQHSLSLINLLSKTPDVHIYTNGIGSVGIVYCHRASDITYK